MERVLTHSGPLAQPELHPNLSPSDDGSLFECIQCWRVSGTLRFDEAMRVVVKIRLSKNETRLHLSESDIVEKVQIGILIIRCDH